MLWLSTVFGLIIKYQSSQSIDPQYRFSPVVHISGKTLIKNLLAKYTSPPRSFAQDGNLNQLQISDDKPV